jgi:hypothetical protein
LHANNFQTTTKELGFSSSTVTKWIGTCYLY